MHVVPTKRLLVYVAAGLVVLTVGTIGLVAMRGGPSSPTTEIVIGAAGEAGGLPGIDSPSGAAGLDVGLDAEITSTTQAPRIWVQVTGAVRRPGVYQMAAGCRAFEAVLEAGGFTDEADQQAVALAAVVGDGCRVYVPKIGESPDGVVQVPTLSSAGISGGQSAGGGSGSGAADKVSLNAATLEQLDELPGVGPAIAQQIVTYREALGPFTSIDQLAEVPGIGPSKLEQLRPLVVL